MMRKLLLPIVALAALAGCDNVAYSVDEVILPSPLVMPKGATADLSMFRKVYVNGSLAMFFVGDGSSMTVAFVNTDGLVDGGHLLSREVAKQHGDDSIATAHNEIDHALTTLSLPDRGFQVLPAQGGALLQVVYGKLSYLSYATFDGTALRIGSAADTNLIASLAASTGLTSAFRALPGLGDPGSADPPQRLLLFTSSPEGLARMICDNAGAIFRKTSQLSAEWTVLDIPTPTSLSDTTAIEGIRVHLAAKMASDAILNESATLNESAADSVDTMSEDVITNAM